MSEPLRILDVSEHQGQIDWAAVKGAGITGALAKSTEGLGWKDRAFDANWAGLSTHNLAKGCYHFSRPEWNDATHEAAWFLSVVPHLNLYDLCALDIETGPQDGRDLSAWALTWLEHVADVLHITPLLYTYLSFAEYRLKDPALARYPLWCAAYQAECPPSVGVWKEVALWQHSSSVQYPGIQGFVDESLIWRDLAGLRRLGKPPAPHKIVILKDMMLRSAPEASHVYFPVQLCYKGATLDVIGEEENGWLPVHAGTRTGWVLSENTRRVA